MEEEIHEILEFNEHKLNMYGYKDNPAFNPNEICNILNIKNDKLVSELRKKYLFEPSILEGPYNRGKSIKLITERGFHELIFRTNSNQADGLKDYISNILKNLRGENN
jgi:prophage antirepressor-like protein